MTIDPTTIHYTTSNPEKIVSSIKRAEKKAIKGAADGLRIAYWGMRFLPEEKRKDAREFIMQRVKLPKQMNIEDFSDDLIIPHILETSTPVVIKQWSAGVSLYPNRNLVQKSENGWWNITSLYSNTTKEDTGLYFWTKDVLYCGEYFVSKKGEVDKYEGTFEETDSYINKPGALAKLDGGNVLKNWLKYIPEDKQTDDLKNIPLLLPVNWRDIWKITEQTRLITVCE